MAWSQTNPQYTHETVVQENLVSLCKQLRKLPANFSWEDNQRNFKATGISSEQYGGHRYYTITGQGFCDFGIILVEESVSTEPKSVSQKRNLIIVLLYIVLKKITTTTTPHFGL